MRRAREDQGASGSREAVKRGRIMAMWKRQGRQQGPSLAGLVLGAPPATGMSRAAAGAALPRNGRARGARRVWRTRLPSRRLARSLVLDWNEYGWSMAGPGGSTWWGPASAAHQRLSAAPSAQERRHWASLLQAGHRKACLCCMPEALRGRGDGKLGLKKPGGASAIACAALQVGLGWDKAPRRAADWLGAPKGHGGSKSGRMEGPAHQHGWGASWVGGTQAGAAMLLAPHAAVRLLPSAAAREGKWGGGRDGGTGAHSDGAGADSRRRGAPQGEVVLKGRALGRGVSDSQSAWGAGIRCYGSGQGGRSVGRPRRGHSSAWRARPWGAGSWQ